MEFRSGDPDHQQHHHHHHHRHHDDEERDSDRRRQPFDENDRYSPPRGGEQRYPSHDHEYPPPEQHYPPPVCSDPYHRGEEERYPIHGSGGDAFYGEAIHQRPPSSHGGYGSAPQVFDDIPAPLIATSGYIQHIEHHVSDEGPYGYKEGGGGKGHSEEYGGRIGSSKFVGGEGGLNRGKRTVRVLTRVAEGYSLTIRDGIVVLAPADSQDEYQHWIKDEKYSTKVKDEEGFPSFALVNKATGQAIKHSIGETQPVRLVPYDPEHLDTSVLWTESSDTGENFHCIRMVDNIRLNFDAFHGDKEHGGVRDGTTIVLWEWLNGDNQKWKIVPY